MFTPWQPQNIELAFFPGVNFSSDNSGGTIVTLSYGQRVIEFSFDWTIATYCIEESIYYLSSVPGFPIEDDFTPPQEPRTITPVFRSSANYRKSIYEYLDSYKANSVLESFIFFGQDFVVLVESIGNVAISERNEGLTSHPSRPAKAGG